MDLSTLTAGLSNPATLIPQIIRDRRVVYEAEAYANFEPEYHRVNNKFYRKDRITSTPVPGAAQDDNGNTPMQTNVIPVARLALALQKLIVKTAAIFATGGDTTLNSDADTTQEQELLQAVKNIWKKNKLRYKNGPLFKAVQSQLEAAEIWYSTADRDESGRVVKAEMRVRMYYPADGWDLIPVFDNYGDMIAFGLKYKDTISGKTFLDLYTSTELRKYVQESGYGWQEREKALPLTYGKIPVIYYEVPKADYADVQSLIDELEKLLSTYADAIDYNAWPILALFGSPVSLPNKGEAGKVIEFESGATASYLSWDQNPVAVTTMVDILMRNIYSLTQTPDLSFEAMRGLGDVSGIAFKRMLISAHAKAKDNQEGWYGEGIQRRLNFLIAAAKTVNPELSNVDIDITPSFSLFDIDDEEGRVRLAMLANGNKPVISQEESIPVAGISQDTEATLQKLNEEKELDTNNGEGQNELNTP